MATIAGYKGGVSIGPVDEARTLYVVKKWELEDKVNLEDVTGMERLASPLGRKEFAPNLSEFSVNIECLLDDVDPNLVTQVDTDDPEVGDPCGVFLYLDPTKDTLAYNLEGVVQSIKPTVEVDGQVKWSLTVQGQGELVAFPTDPPA